HRLPVLFGQASRGLKQLRFTKDGPTTTVVELVDCDSKSKPSSPKLNFDSIGHPQETCPVTKLSQAGINLDYTDVKVLAQFLRPDGSILPKEATGLSLKAQYHIEMLIERARNAGLMPLEIGPDGQHVYIEQPRDQFNVYYNSKIIGLPTAKKASWQYSPPDD
ncbi:hypothetical protein BOX15_Mlig002955g2, partial [Macrostomum lignano]